LFILLLISISIISCTAKLVDFISHSVLPRLYSLFETNKASPKERPVTSIQPFFHSQSSSACCLHCAYQAVHHCIDLDVVLPSFNTLFLSCSFIICSLSYSYVSRLRDPRGDSCLISQAFFLDRLSSSSGVLHKFWGVRLVDHALPFVHI
jgi:hypothetical protein